MFVYISLFLWLFLTVFLVSSNLRQAETGFLFYFEVAITTKLGIRPSHFWGSIYVKSSTNSSHVQSALIEAQIRSGRQTFQLDIYPENKYSSWVEVSFCYSMPIELRLLCQIFSNLGGLKIAWFGQAIQTNTRNTLFVRFHRTRGVLYKTADNVAECCALIPIFCHITDSF